MGISTTNQVGWKEWALISLLVIGVVAFCLHRYRYKPAMAALDEKSNQNSGLQWPKDSEEETNRLKRKGEKIKDDSEKTKDEIQKLLGAFTKNEFERQALLSEISSLAVKCGLRVQRLSQFAPDQFGVGPNKASMKKPQFMERLEEAGLEPMPLLQIQAKASFPGLIKFATALPKLSHRVTVVHFDVGGEEASLESLLKKQKPSAPPLNFSALLAL